MTMAFIGSTAAPIIGGLLGNIFSGGERKAAEEAQEKAMAEIERLGAGPDLAKQIYLQEFKSAGVLTPEVERAVDVGVSQVAQIQEDPRLKQAQLRALTELQQRGRTGFTAEERAQLSQERAAAERSAEAKRQQIVAGLRARGALDSGAGLAAQLESADVLAAQQAEAADRLTSSASKRALESIIQGGEFGSRMRGQEFDIARTKAGAQDEMNRFNIQNRMQQEARRAQAATSAQEFNLRQQQALMDANIQQANAERLRQLQAQQQMYQNQLNIAQLKSGVYSQQAQQAQQQAAQKQQGWTQAGQAIGQGIGAYGQYEAGKDLKDAQTNYYKSLATKNAPSVPPVAPVWNVPMDSNLQMVSPLGVEDYMTQQSRLPSW